MNPKGRPNALLAGLWLLFAALNVYFGFSMHAILDWFVAAGCLVVAGVYALSLVRK
jgi:hypothetical protein